MIQIKNCRYGRMLYNDQDLFIGQAFDHYGEFSESEVNFYRQVVQPGMVVIDVGANIGGITIPLAQQAAKVYAFEPQRWIYYQLCANVVLNNLSNVRCYQKALGKIVGQTRIPMLDYNVPINSGGIGTSDEWDAGISEPVAVTTIDKLAVAPQFIKIDAEGHELEILEGATKTLRQHRPFLSIEALDNREAMTFLKEFHYKVLFMAFPGFNPDNFFNNPEEVFIPKGVGSPTLICLPDNVTLTIGNTVY